MKSYHAIIVTMIWAASGADVWRIVLSAIWFAFAVVLYHYELKNIMESGSHD